VSPTTFRAALVAVALLRVIALPLPGTEDMGVWKVWSHAASQDLTGAYGIGGSPPEHRLLHFGNAYTTVDYPPVAIYEMAVVGHVYRAIWPDYPNDWRLSVAVKLPGLLAGALLTALLYAVAGAATGSTAAAQFAALGYWANPATIINGETLGYLDPLMALPTVGALAALHSRRAWLAGPAYAVALLTKPQAMLAGPAIALAAWRIGGWRRLILTGALGLAVLVLIAAPFLAAGAAANMWNAFGSWQSRRDILSGNAANAWWVATWLARGYNMIPLFGFPGAYFEPVQRILAISSWMEMGLPNPRPIGTALVLAGVAWGVWRTWPARSLAAHAALTAFTVYVFFVFAVSVHEHHLMTAVPFAVLAGAIDRRFRAGAVLISGVAALNMNLFYGLSRGWGWALPRMITPIDASVLLALVAVGGLVYYGRVLGRVASAV
jgi:hypothetical protein